MTVRRPWTALDPGIWCFILAAAVIAAGCGPDLVLHEARKPVVDLEDTPVEPGASWPLELDVSLEQLREEQSSLTVAIDAIERRKRQSLQRFARSVGSDYDNLRTADSTAITLYLASREGSKAVIHARELALHAKHIVCAERRLILLDLAIVEGESHLRFRQNYVATGLEPRVDDVLVGKLAAIASERLELSWTVSKRRGDADRGHRTRCR